MRWSRILTIVGVMVIGGSVLTASAQSDPEQPAAADASAPVQVLSGAFGSVAIAFDPAGHRHLVASSDVAGFAAGGDLWYATDRSGSWLSERLQEGRGCEGSWVDPDLAVDADGSLHIVAALGLPCDVPGGSRGIYHMTDQGRTPGDFGPSIRVSRRGVEWPTVAVRDGVISLAYARVPIPREPSPVTFSTDRTGEWRTQRLAEAGSMPTLRLDGEGRAHVVFADRRGLRYASQAVPDGPLSDPERVPSSAGHPGVASLDLDAAGRPAIAWVAGVGAGSGLLWSPPAPTGWGERESVGGASLAALRYDATGRPHLAYLTSSEVDGDVIHGLLDEGAWVWSTLATSDSLGGVAIDTSGPSAAVAWAGGPEGAGGIWVSDVGDPVAS